MNGNGDTGDEIPFGMLGGNIEQLMSIFGVVDAQGHRMVIDDFETRGQPLSDPRVRPVLQVK